MTSGDLNAARALLTLADEPEWKKDVARLATGTLSRMRGGHWDLTTANAWGVLAVERFAELFEKTPVAGSTSVALGSEKKSLEWKGKDPQSHRFSWPGKAEPLLVRHAGAGAPWMSLLAFAAVPLKEPLWAGYRIEKTLTPVDQKTKGRWSRGDLVRVSLKIHAQSDMTWAVVNDPIPAGSSVLGTGLARDSALATAGEKTTGSYASVAFEERSFEGFRRYLEYLPQGEYGFEYTVRLNNPGKFQLPPTRVEAMYAPETFGELPNAPWEVAP
jgi:alpha-2-macroglobulin